MVNKCVDIVVGLQGGSEAKGKLITALQDVSYKAICRSGSTNASHGVVFNGNKIFFHQFPCGCLHFPKAKIILTGNAQIDHEYLNKEIQILKDNNRWLDENGKPRLIIDPNATIIDSVDKMAENGGRMPDCGELYYHPRDCTVHNLAHDRQAGDEKAWTKVAGTCVGCPKLPADSAWAKLGSTTHGGGANSIRKITRGTKMAIMLGQEFDLAKYFRSKLPEDATNDEIQEFILETVNNGPIRDWAPAVEASPVRFASDDQVIKPFIGDTVDILNRMIDHNESILLEGTQGSILSLHFGPQGKTTSRDTNASNWVMEAGISPLAVRDIYGVCRTFPIRVFGDSGPMPGTEITWEEVTKFSGSPEPIVELTSATKRKRRVSTFGEESFRRALDLNRPTKLMLSFVDYLNYEDKDKSSWDSLTQKTRDWITVLETKMGIFFNYLSTGPAPEHTIIRKSPGELAVQAQIGRQTL